MTAGARRALARHIGRARRELAETWCANQFASGLVERFPNPYAEDVDRTALIGRFYEPLLDLLADAARNDNGVTQALYVAERRRYAPHRDGQEVLARFFSELLPADTAALLTDLEVRHHGDARQWLEEVHRPLVHTAARQTRVLMLGDCLLSEIQPFLVAQAAQAQIDLDLRYFYFSARLGTDVATDSIRALLEKTPVDVIAISFLSYEGIPLYRALLKNARTASASERTQSVEQLFSIMLQYMTSLREWTEAPILIHNASGLPLSRWRRLFPMGPALSPAVREILTQLNERIAELASHLPNCRVIDEVTVAARRGLRACARPLVPAIARRGEFHPTTFGIELADEYFKFITAYEQLRGVKVLLVDFDNTLWQGVMADGPVRHYVERQQLLARLQRSGILLAAVSKNTPANIRWDEMAMSRDDFAVEKISWNMKAQSVAEIAEELNLGRDSFLLIDDSPEERALVREHLSDVRVIDGAAPETWTMLELLFSLPNTRETEEARTRTAMYRAQAERRRAMDPGLDYPSMMRALELRAGVRLAKTRDLDRVSELVQRTNQFNTMTIRHSRTELERFLADPCSDVYIGELEDRFGSLGIVAVVIVTTSDDQVTLENVVMSCRAMGFGMEIAMLARVLADCAQSKRVVGRFRPTARNEPSSTVFRDAGFCEEAEGVWVLTADAPRPEVPAWFAGE